jgi:YfiH family protein
MLPWIEAGRPLPDNVCARVTVRSGGVSTGAWGLPGHRPGGLNLGARCGDDPQAVLENRRRLEAALAAVPCWLDQVHGTRVHHAVALAPDDNNGVEPRADAAVTDLPGRVLSILTADCLPVLFSDGAGRRVGAAHAGWRGLAAGVIEQTVDAIRRLPGEDDALVAWLGPAIGPAAFEVGEEVLEAFVAHDAAAGDCFRRGDRQGKWFADLFGLARQRLADAGVGEVGGGGLCTVSDADRFYSHRRDRTSGRMASLIWIKPGR